MKTQKYAAEEYIASPGRESLGRALLGLIQNIQAEEIQPILAKYGWHEIDPNTWYPHQTWLDILKEIFEGETNSTTNLVAIGIKVVEMGAKPLGINSLEDALRAFPKMQQMNGRNFAEGEGFVVKFIGKHYVHVIKNTPSPNDFIYGCLWGLTNRFKASDHQFVVRIIENSNPTEEPGTVFQIKWGLDVDGLDSVD